MRMSGEMMPNNLVVKHSSNLSRVRRNAGEAFTVEVNRQTHQPNK